MLIHALRRLLAGERSDRMITQDVVIDNKTVSLVAVVVSKTECYGSALKLYVEKLAWVQTGTPVKMERFATEADVAELSFVYWD